MIWPTYLSETRFLLSIERNADSLHVHPAEGDFSLLSIERAYSSSPVERCPCTCNAWCNACHTSLSQLNVKLLMQRDKNDIAESSRVEMSFCLAPYDHVVSVNIAVPEPGMIRERRERGERRAKEGKSEGCARLVLRAMCDTRRRGERERERERERREERRRERWICWHSWL